MKRITLVLLVMLIAPVMAVAPTSNFYLVPTDMKVYSMVPYDAMVYQDGTYTIAVNRTGGIISSVLTSSHTDNTVIQVAIDTRNSYISAGNYTVTPGAPTLDIPSDSVTTFSPNAIIQNGAHNLQTYQMIRIWDRNNVTIYTPNLDGNRAGNAATTGEYGHGISILGSTNIEIYNPTIKNCWGDGIYIGSLTLPYSENVLIVDPIIDKSRRDGISIISGKHINIVRPRVTNTGGTSPEAGINLEPNSNTQFLENIRIDSPYTSGTAGPALLMYLGKLIDVNKSVSIYVNNHVSYNDLYNSFYANGIGNGTVQGTVTIVDPEWIKSMYSAMWVHTWTTNLPLLTIVRPHVIDCNVDNGNNRKESSAFSIFSDVSDAGPVRLGHVIIEDPDVISTGGGRPYGTLYVSDNRTASYGSPLNISFINPTNVVSQPGNNAVNVNASVIVEDRYGVL